MTSREVSGRQVQIPVHVRDAQSGIATFSASTAAAQSMLPTDELAIASFAPRRTLVNIGFVDYIDNDLGTYLEVLVTFYVRLHGEGLARSYAKNLRDLARGGLGTWIHQLPVSQQFTCDAGVSIWGFPKTVQQIEVDTRPRWARCRLSMDGEHAFSLAVARGGSLKLPDTNIKTFTVIERELHSTDSVQAGAGMGIFPGGARLSLGTAPLAKELGELHLSQTAKFAIWIERLTGTFNGPTPA